MTLTDVNIAISTLKLKTEEQTITRFFAEQIPDASLAGAATFINMSLPARHKITRATIHNWIWGNTRMNEATLMSLKQAYPPEDPRHQLALTIESMRNEKEK